MCFEEIPHDFFFCVQDEERISNTLIIEYLFIYVFIHVFIILLTTDRMAGNQSFCTGYILEPLSQFRNC